MRKARIHELAKEVGISSAAAVRMLREAGFSAKSHASSVERAAALGVLREAAADADATHEEPPAPRSRRARRRRQRPDAPPGTVVIKKYGNRRLYSTDESRYLTLEELEGLVRKGRKVQVVDATTAEDLTSQVLAQILLEGGRARRFPVSFLEQIIRLRDDALQTFFGRYLMTGLDMFLASQREMERRYQQTLSGFGLWPFAPRSDEHPEANAAARPDPLQTEPPAPSPEPTGQDEMALLRQRLEQLERQVTAQNERSQKK